LVGARVGVGECNSAAHGMSGEEKRDVWMPLKAVQEELIDVRKKV
jgi:hypothetical protein